MKFRDCYEGLCVINEYGDEGVVVYANNTGRVVVTLERFFNDKLERNGYFSNTSGYYEGEVEHKLEMAIVPHFCFVENVYSILEKYLKDKEFYLFGCATVYEENKHMTDSLYLKIEDKYMEIVICYWNGDIEKEPVIWINEVENIQDLHWLNHYDTDKAHVKYDFLYQNSMTLDESEEYTKGFCFKHDGRRAFSLDCSERKKELSMNVSTNLYKKTDFEEFIQIIKGAKL